MSNPTEEMNEILSAAYDTVIEPQIAVIEDATTEEVEEMESSSIEEESVEEEIEDEVVDEDDVEEEIDEKEPSFADSLKGKFSKENIELLESIEDHDLRSKLVEEGIKQRSDLDRKRQELGESKKLSETLDNLVKINNLPYNKQQYTSLIENYANLDAMLVKDPVAAIKILAENAKVDLSTLVSVPQAQDDQEDYRLPEEIALDNRLKALEDREQRQEQQLEQQKAISVQQEVSNFMNTVDESGHLKYPHFEKVKMDMSLFFNDNNPEMTMEKAYQKAIMLNPDLLAQRDVEVLRQQELKRQEKITKAKKLKRQSIRSSKVTARTIDHDTLLENAVNAHYS